MKVALQDSAAPSGASRNITLPASLVTAVRDQRAIIFLGAGASLEGTDRTGKQTLSANELRDALSLHFLNEVIPYNLMDTAERLIVQNGQPAVFNYIRSLLEPFEPGLSHGLLPKFRWRAIATTNYDLLIERAYKNERGRLQNPVIFVKDTDQVDEGLRNTTNGLEVIKLHGCLLDDSVPLILSNEHYARYISSRERLFGRLRDYAHEHPIIFCGYSLSDPHIRDLIYRLDHVSRPMFYIVAPGTNELDRALYSSLKVEIIDAKFGEFMAALDVAIPEPTRVLRVAKEVVEVPIRKHYKSNATESAKLTNFLQRDALFIHGGMEFAAQGAKEFYRGVDTGWGGIVQGFDVRRRVVDDLLYKVLEGQDSKLTRPDFYILKGPAGNGKTISLKRVAWEIATQLDELVLWIDENAALDPEALSELHSLTGKKIYLCIDRVAVHVTRLKRLYDYASKNALPLVIIGAEADGEWYTYCSALEYLKPIEMHVRYLSAIEINGLIDKLEKHNSLGMLEGKTPEEKFKAFEESAERQLLVALHELTQGKRFEDIVFDEYEEIIPEEAKQLYLDICTLNQFSVPVRVGTVSRLSGISFDNYANEIFGPLENIVMDTHDPYTSDRQYKARHVRVAQLVFRRACLSSKAKADQLVRLVEQLDIGYSVDRTALQKITKGQALVRLLDVEDARRVYEAAQAVAPSDGFMLQQWAIMESNHPSGNIAIAQRKIDEARALEPRSKSIMHTQSEIARKRANQETSPVLKEQYRRLSKERLSEIGNATDELVLSTKLKLLLDELEYIYQSDDVDNVIAVEKVRDCESLLELARQHHPDEAEFHSIDARFRGILEEEERVITALERAVAAGSQKDGVTVRLAKAYRGRGDAEKAYKTLDAVLEKLPDSKIVHLTYAKMLLEDRSPSMQKIEGHLSRSYHKGDANHEARHLHAQYLFLIGERGRADQLFQSINENAPADFLPRKPKTHSLVSAQLTRMSGKIYLKNETFVFIKIPDFSGRIFGHEENTDSKTWDALEVNDEISFEVFFNRKGAVAAGIRNKREV